MDKLGQRIREIRIAYRMTQQELADACGHSRVVISKAEKGHRKVSTELLLDVAKAFGITLDELTHASGEEAATVLNVWRRIPPAKREDAIRVLSGFIPNHAS